MKYKDKPFALSKAYLRTLEDRRELFRAGTKTNRALHLTIIAPYGITDNAQAKQIQSVVTMEDLYM